MPKKELKPLPFIGELTEQWIKASYPRANAHDARGANMIIYWLV